RSVYHSQQLHPCKLLILKFFFSCFRAHLVLHSFPTRRSSDLSDLFQPLNDALFPIVNHLPCARIQRALRFLRTADGTNQFCTQRSEEHTSELQSRENLVCRLLLEKKKKKTAHYSPIHPLCRAT